MKEFFRKLMVSIKRRPQNIALVALVVAFVYYSFNLTKISDTTAKIQGQNMGLCGFVTMLFSLLVFVCFLNSFPKRKKPNFAMIALMYVMFGAMIYSDIIYNKRIAAAVAREEFAAALESSPYILQASHIVSVHIVLLIVVAVLIALLPVYSKLLRKINTNVSLEYSNSMEAIDVEE